ncbi:insulinase family protein [Aliifodinibius sp. S!AR15-10]|uniref:M16 family metallopeptidase n=1 Tax=Aliifodinibius sp. S!AR15-10 TaxID=2950437 RepID=UPI00285C33A1|nr:pitrilysin family protein [Aliifodinibius sp. S!AR15-10]MDR8391702.1 insulinase family protein [Aliifodinibius sp. S!AR15-10]
MNRSGERIMKRVTSFVILVLCLGMMSAHAQKRYDELTFPELNEFQRPDVETFTLDNGIKFFLVEDDELPLIDLSVNIRTGGVLVPNEKAGLASITGSVIRSGGSVNYPADTLNQILENRAASMETGIGFTSGGASMNVLKEDFSELLPIFVDLLKHPALPQEKIDLEKKQVKSSISRRNDNQRQIGSREFERLIYGKNSVYGRLTEYETVNNITREDLVNFHANHFVGNNMMVGIVGDFDADQIKEQLTEAFSEIAPGSRTELNFPEIDYDYQSTINFIDKPDVNQSYVLMGHIGGLRSNPDYPKVQVMNEVLSGGFSGRLFQVVRTDMGLAYAVFGSYEMNTFYPGQFYTGVMTKSATTAEAIDAIIEQIKRLQNEPIKKQELSDIKDQFLNSMVFRYDSYEEVLSRRMSNEYRELPEDAFEKFIEGVRSTTIKDVQQMAQKYMKPDSMQILVVGNKEEIGDQLQKYGNVNEIDISIPQPGQEKAQEEVAGDATKGRALLDKMANALIAPEQKLDSISIEAEVTQFGSNIPGGSMSLQVSQNIDYPDAIKQTVQTPNGTITLNYEGGQGTMSMMGQERPLPPQQAKSLKESLNRKYLAVAKQNGELKPQFIGMEEFEGSQYAKVSININDKNITYLIDPNTGYPRVMRYQQFNPQQGSQVQVEERYSDWQTVDGVSYAYQEITFSEGEKAAESVIKSHEVN